MPRIPVTVFRLIWGMFKAIVVAIFDRIVWLVDLTLQTYVRTAEPKHTVTFYLLANALIALFMWWKAKDWNEFITVVGFAATVSGLLVTLFELYRARTTTEQVRIVLDREIRRQKDAHYRLCLERALSSLRGATAHIQAWTWRVAVSKLTDLISDLAQVHSASPAADNFWNLSGNSLHAWIAVFDAGTDRRRIAYNVVEWQGVVQPILVRLHDELAVEQPGGEANNDPD
jgi:hypothetical protein